MSRLAAWWIVCSALALAAGSGGMWPSPVQAAGDAASVVTAFHAALKDNQRRGAALGCGGRQKQMATAIDADFDLPFIAQRVLRRNWDTLEEPQRAAFTTAFRELVIATYASQFAHDGGETFTTGDTQTLPTGEQRVHAVLAIGGGRQVVFDYVLHAGGGDAGPWKVINVVADGVSDLALRSTQYDRVFKEKGFDGLLAWIREQKNQTLSECY